MQKKWTSSELEVLIASNGKQMPFLEGRSIESMRQKMMRLGIKAAPKVPNWTLEEIKILSDSDGIPSVKGRSKGAIRNKMNQLGLRRPQKANAWNKEEVEILKAHQGPGLPTVSGRTPDAIRSKMKDLGLFYAKNKRWTKDEIKKLKKLFDLDAEILIPGRSQKAIVKKMHELKLKKTRSKCSWTEFEVQTLKQSGSVPGRSENSIQQMKVRLGLTQGYNQRNKWGSENEEKLKGFYLSGFSAKKIFDMGVFCGQSKMSIQKKLCRMGLAKKIAKSIDKMPMEIKFKFKKFLIESWVGKTVKELVESWNTQNFRFKVNERKVAKELSCLGIKVSCHEMQRIKSLKNKESKIISTNTGTSSLMIEKIRLERVKVMKARYESSKDIWTGLESKEEEIDFSAV